MFSVPHNLSVAIYGPASLLMPGSFAFGNCILLCCYQQGLLVQHLKAEQLACGGGPKPGGFALFPGHFFLEMHSEHMHEVVEKEVSGAVNKFVNRTEYSELEGPMRIMEPNPWLRTAPPKIQTLCLRAVSNCSLSSSTCGCATQVSMSISLNCLPLLVTGLYWFRLIWFPKKGCADCSKWIK